MSSVAHHRWESVADVLGRVVRGLDIEKQLRSRSVEPAWRRAVGEKMALGTRPSRLKGGVLLVETRSAAWMTEASLLREGIRAAVNRELGGDFVRELRFRLGAGFPPIGSGAGTRLSVSEDEVQREVERLSASSAAGARLVARARALQRKKAARAGKPR